MNPLKVIEQLLPGLGKRFEFQLDADHDLAVVALRDGTRHLAILDRTNAEPVTTTIELDPDQAVTLGALLLGARFTIDTLPAPQRVGATVVDTVAVTANAPALGMTPSAALAALDADAIVLAVIRNNSGEVVENHLEIELSAGDRVAIAVRHDRHHDAVYTLSGGEPDLELEPNLEVE